MKCSIPASETVYVARNAALRSVVKIRRVPTAVLRPGAPVRGAHARQARSTGVDPRASASARTGRREHAPHRLEAFGQIGDEVRGIFESHV